ncbi:UbiA family prenyltransferase [Thalassococcus sp. BH17M4-6]|uniref:UbiA family prenyltransferase n=1 Tax=Thalassococcus sp. BH17M4-6 TaxID=3413148 RepID=UPI003BC0B8F5
MPMVAEPVSVMREILVVDLDGTLLKSDMLLESFWSAFGQDWLSPFGSVAALSRGKAPLKRYLARSAQINVKTLPYDSQVISYVEAWRQAGGRTALVTASDEKFAQDIGDYLQIFDEVHGSDGSENLKGQHKARFLVERYGQGNFSYMGDSKADLAVWKHAKRAITVNLSADMRKRATQVSARIEHLVTHTPTADAYLKAVRPNQWIKNALVFLPMLAAHQIDGASFFASLLAFISFSLIASSVYVLNDLLDLEADRAHPRKRQRPFAAGRIPIASGTWMASGLLGAGAVVAAFLGPLFLGVMLGYYALTMGYSLYLKRRMIVDICVLAGLYTMRLVAGGAATGIPLSVWLLAFSMFFFLSLAAVKRQAELVDSAKHGKLKASGRGYHVSDLPIISMIAISAGYVAVLVMALYVNSPEVAELYKHTETLWGVCAILVYWITRTVMLAHRGEMHDDPVVYAAKDKISLVCFLTIFVLAIAGAIF